jgi:hypothetical protein
MTTKCLQRPGTVRSAALMAVVCKERRVEWFYLRMSGFGTDCAEKGVSSANKNDLTYWLKIFNHPPPPPWLYSPRRTLASSHMRFLELFRHMVELLGRVKSPSQGLYLHRTTQHRKTRTNIHALSGIRIHDPSNQPAKTHENVHHFYIIKLVRSEVLTAVKTSKLVFWVVKPCGLRESVTGDF